MEVHSAAARSAPRSWEACPPAAAAARVHSNPHHRPSVAVACCTPAAPVCVCVRSTPRPPAPPRYVVRRTAWTSNRRHLYMVHRPIHMAPGPASHVYHQVQPGRAGPGRRAGLHRAHRAGHGPAARGARRLLAGAVQYYAAVLRCTTCETACPACCRRGVPPARVAVVFCVLVGRGQSAFGDLR